MASMKSMESAPKDGRCIILIGPVCSTATKTVTVTVKEAYWDSELSKTYGWLDQYKSQIGFEPTGWMELPTVNSPIEEQVSSWEVINAVFRERLEQIQKHGFTVERDLDLYGVTGSNDLLRAAVCYIKNPAEVEDRRNGWPWSLQWWKPHCLSKTITTWTVANRVKELVKAAALIVAHIEMQLRIQQQIDAKRKQINEI